MGSGDVKIATNDSGATDVSVDEESNVTLSFALRYLVMFSKASHLSSNVRLMLAADTPLLVEYKISKYGQLKYYLAPKINEAMN